MEVYEKVVGRKCKVAVFDDKMRIIMPIFKFLEWLKATYSKPNTVVAYGHDLKTYFELLKLKGYDYLPFKPRMLDELKTYLNEPFHNEKAYHIAEPSENVSKRKSTTCNRIIGTVYLFYIYLDWELNADAEMVSDPYNPGVQQFTSLFNGFLELARRSGKSVKSYFKVKNRQEDESEEDKIDDFRILSEYEYKMILDALDNKRDRLLFKFLYFSGVRISSATSLTIDNIKVPNFDHKWTVIKIKNPTGSNRRQQLKKGSHKVFVPTELIEELDNYIMEERVRMRLPHGYIFVALNKKDYGHVLTREAVGKKYAAIAKKLGIAHFTPHTLRHTCCTNLLAAGVSLHTTMKIMNHDSILTTMKYEHIGDEHVLKELDSYWDGLSVFAEREMLKEDE